MAAESERALNLDYASKLWAFANGVTAFAMLQLVGVLFAIGTNEMMRVVVASCGGALAVAGGHAVGACVYLSLLGWCHRREDQLLSCAGGVPPAVLTTTEAARRWRHWGVLAAYVIGIALTAVQPFFPLPETIRLKMTAEDRRGAVRGAGGAGDKAAGEERAKP